MAYEAIVCKVSVRPHPNANRLQLGNCKGYQVVVGLDTKEGDLGVYFPCDGALDREFCLENGLFSQAALDKLEIHYGEGQPFGFFDHKGRVRAQKFRGEKSDGFWVPLSYFSYTGVEESWLEDGFVFTSLNGREICRKYEAPATKQAQGKIGKRQRENKCFPKHDVTKQFRFVSDKIPQDAVIWITEKLHGTSGRYGHVLDDLYLPLWKRAINRVLKVFPERVYTYLNGSKNVILEKTTGAGWYGTNEFRYKAIDGLEVFKGEILYFEIVGFFENKEGHPKAIMEPQPVKDEVKSLRKTYGDIMIYKYGLEPPNSTMYVYKIVRMNEDGVGTDLSWPQVAARCAELGLKTVPVLAGPFTVADLAKPLGEVVDDLTDGPSVLDSGHIREGVVLRIESTSGIEYVKSKSWYFGVLEGYLKDSEDFIDTEEAS